MTLPTPLPMFSTLHSARPGALPALVHAPMTVAEASALITAGRVCCVAGDEALLRQLPTGAWIGGSIPYFITEAGGVCLHDRVFVSELPASAGVRARIHDRDNLSGLCLDAPDHGCTVLILPAFSAVHEAYAQEAPAYPDMYMRPLVGWVSGCHLEAIGRQPPTVFHGPSGQALSDRAVALHVPLPAGVRAHVDIVNLFEPAGGAAITFGEPGFAVTQAQVDGRDVNLHDWLLASGHDLRWPLVADHCGATVNVSIKRLDAATRRVEFFAPVFPGFSYHVARPTDADHGRGLGRALASQPPPGPAAFSCHCILNYTHGGLEGRPLPALADLHGPATFGEIGYQLLNQTLVYLCLVED